MQELVKSISGVQKEGFLDFDEEMCNAERQVNYKIEDLQGKQLELGKFLKDLDVETEKEGAIFFRKELRVRSLDFCQFLGANGYGQPKDSGAPDLPKPTILNMGSSTVNCVSFTETIIHDTGLGFSVMTRGNPPKVENTPDKKIASPNLDHSTSRFKKNKEVSMKEVRAKILSAIKLMEGCSESKFLLNNDKEFKSQYEGLLAVSERMARKRRAPKKPVSKRIPEKKGVVYRREPHDPRDIIITCSINGVLIAGCKVDFRANRSIMPLKLAKLAVISNIKLTGTKLALSDGTTKELVGIAENVLLGYEDSIFSTNFLVLSSPEDTQTRVILGLPFLIASKASICTRDKKLVFAIGEQDNRTRKRNDKRQKLSGDELDSSLEYGFFVGNTEESKESKYFRNYEATKQRVPKRKSSHDKSSNAKKKDKTSRKKWRVKEKDKPGASGFDPLQLLRGPPVL